MGKVNLSDGNKCPICGKLGAEINSNGAKDAFFYYHCTDCGCFFVPDPYRSYPEIKLGDIYNIEHLRSYMFYHKTHLRPIICDKDYFNKNVDDKFIEIYNLTPEMVEGWYPKNFAEKIDHILLYFNKNSKYIGEEKYYKYSQLIEILMLENKDIGKTGELIDSPIYSQIQYYLDYFYKENLLSNVKSPTTRAIPVWESSVIIQLAPRGLARIDYLLKNHIDNKNVFVAMSFGEGTKALREKIKEGLNGFNVRIMDEIEHNHQIVPEMLYEIRNSRFVIYKV